MKATVIFGAIFAAVLFSSAPAEEIWRPFEKKEKPIKMKTGYEVRGCSDYYIDRNGRVKNVCKKQVGERWWWFDVTPWQG